MILRERIAIITGAGHPRGIGRGIALALAGAGAGLVLADVDRAGAEAIAQEVRAMDRRAVAVKTDVSREEEVTALVDAAVGEFGRIDILVANAGASQHQPVLEVSSEEWDWMMGVNLRGAFLCARAVLPTMIRQGNGRIVFISSMLAKSGAGPKRGAHYAASKAGVIGLAKTVALQAAPYGITSNVVAPGYIDTDLARAWESAEETAERRRAEGQVSQIPLGRLGTPRDVAEAVLFLVSDRASYITGEVLDVNGGMHID